MSYLDYYNLKEPPFANVPDLRYFYSGSCFGEAYSKLIMCIEGSKQLTTVYGKCGLGKTVLSRKLFNSFETKEKKYEAFLLVCIHSNMNAGWLLQKMARQLHINLSDVDKSDYFEKVTGKLKSICEAGKHIIIIIDEASMIANMEVFEEIRGFIDFMADSQFKFSCVFFGLPTLEEKLSANQPLLQRVEARVILSEFPTSSVTKDYIEHRLRIAGLNEPVFTDKAYQYIHFSSKGNPRLINIIADNTLTEGHLLKIKQLDEKEVESVIIEMGYNTRMKSLFLDS
ncbi:MAG: AAA family ATPase [Candidatus Firestonebacteria bacterium]